MGRLEKIKDITVICSSIAVPIVIAVGAWYIQYSIAKDSVRKDYVQVAANILLNSKSNEADPELRKWAINVFNSYSPIPLNDELKKNLQTGIMRVYVPEVSPAALNYSPKFHSLFIKISDGQPESDMGKVVNNIIAAAKRGKAFTKTYKPFTFSNILDAQLNNSYEIIQCDTEIDYWRKHYFLMKDFAESINKL